MSLKHVGLSAARRNGGSSADVASDLKPDWSQPVNISHTNTHARSSAHSPPTPPPSLSVALWASSLVPFFSFSITSLFLAARAQDGAEVFFLSLFLFFFFFFQQNFGVLFRLFCLPKVSASCSDLWENAGVKKNLHVSRRYFYEGWSLKTARRAGLHRGTTGIQVVFRGEIQKFDTKKQLETYYLISIMAEITHLLSPSYDIPAQTLFLPTLSWCWCGVAMVTWCRCVTSRETS